MSNGSPPSGSPPSGPPPSGSPPSGSKPQGEGGSKSSRRRRRRKRPAKQSGDAGAQAQRRPGQQGAPQGQTSPRGETKSKPSRRRRRRPKKQPSEQQGPPKEDNANAPAGPAATASTSSPGKSKRRGRRRRRPTRAGEPARPSGSGSSRRAGAAPAEAVDQEAARQVLPSEAGWDLDSQTPTPPPRPREPEEPPITDPDDLVLALAPGDDEEPAEDDGGQLTNVLPVRFRDHSDVRPFDAGEQSIAAGEQVVVESDQGLTIGCAACASHRCLVHDALPRMTRKLDANDQRQLTRNRTREQEALEFCRQRIRERKLPMTLIRVEYLHSGNKAMFYFAAEHRVDFRDLVRDLAQRLHTRIVMRQVGVRDEAKMTGGIGSCGMPLCCSSWLAKFEPVSIRMAKDQNLVLNPQKVSGQCGRLKCCLNYEHALYQQARKKLPKAGRMVKTPDGTGKVQELDILRGMVRVYLGDGSSKTYSAEQVSAVPRQSNDAAKE